MNKDVIEFYADYVVGGLTYGDRTEIKREVENAKESYYRDNLDITVGRTWIDGYNVWFIYDNANNKFSRVHLEEWVAEMINVK